MWVSVGQLYSSQRLLQWISEGQLKPSDIEGSDVTTVLVCPAADVLEVVFRGGWASVDVEGVLRLTERGRSVRSMDDATICLREQLRDLISSEKPVWTKLIGRGRQELAKSVPSEVSQTLTEAGLLEKPASPEVVRWWDEMSELARGIRAADLMVVGRTGERLTLRYERDRTTVEPVWQAIESNLSGFDVLSVVNIHDTTPLRIEVKASARTINAADFSLTRHEWRTASTTRNYVFHLWQIPDGGRPRLAVVPFGELGPHVPVDAGDGEWQQVRVPFSAFKKHFAEVR